MNPDTEAGGHPVRRGVPPGVSRTGARRAARALLMVPLLLLVLPASRLGPSPLRAQWTPRPGQLKLFPSVSYFGTDSQFDASGDRHEFDRGGEFQQFESRLYFEYGLVDRLALVGNAFLGVASFSTRDESLSNTGLGPPELALRYRLTGSGAPLVASVQAAVKLPEATSGRPRLGNEQTDLEGRLLLGSSIPLGRPGGFWALEGAYRHRTEGFADDFRFAGTLGLDLAEGTRVELQSTGIVAVEDVTLRESGLNPNLRPDFDLVRVQGSLVQRLAGSTRLQAGGFGHVSGRNTGAGAGAFLSLWLSVPGSPP